MNKEKIKKKGFIALTTVLFISGVLLALVFASSIESGTFFDQALHKEYREMNYYYAYDCIDQAILILAHDYFFDPLSPVSIPEFHCQILSVKEDGEKRVIKTVGNFMKANVYRKAVVLVKERSFEVVLVE